MAPEAWEWPPVYDESYRPEPGARHWFPVRETMPAADREALVLERIRRVMAYAYERSTFYKRKWSDAGVDPAAIRSLEDFERVPVITKAELRQAQAEHPPFGDYLCIDEDEVRHVHGTSGTTGRPTAFGISQRDWRAIANAHARVLWGMGIRPGDTVFIGSFFSLYLGSWGALIGAERLGARVFPFGAGVPGQTQRAVMWLREMKPDAFYGTPSFAIHLTEVCDPRTFRRVPYGREGTPVYTHLERTSQPMIRLLSNDLTRWEMPASRPDGRTYPVLPRGVYGRIDDMFTVRGENVYPAAIDEVVMALEHYGGEHRILVTRERAMDELAVRIECDAALYGMGAASVDGFRRLAEERLRRVLGVGAQVEVVAPGTLERTEFKARRVVDAREV